MNDQEKKCNLFWYPEMNYQRLFEKPDKGLMLESYVRYFLARLQSMFKYENLPETIPQKWLENYLMCNGHCGIIKAEEGLLYAVQGGLGGDCDEYYVPKIYTVANPYLKTKTMYVRDVDIIVIFNDVYIQGVMPLLNRYCMQLVENEITLNIADILSRATIIMSATDDKTKASAELFIKRLRDGDLSVIAEKSFVENSLHINQFKEVTDTLTNLIEYHQYIKASLYNELGLNSNYNMKRESINSNESQLNDDMLHPLIDDMLKCRKEGIEKVNEMFGTNITVEFDSAWKVNEDEEQVILDSITEDDGVVDQDNEGGEKDDEEIN